MFLLSAASLLGWVGSRTSPSARSVRVRSANRNSAGSQEAVRRNPAPNVAARRVVAALGASSPSSSSSTRRWARRWRSGPVVVASAGWDEAEDAGFEAGYGDEEAEDDDDDDDDEDDDELERPDWLAKVDRETLRAVVSAREYEVIVARYYERRRPSQLEVSFGLGTSVSRVSVLERRARAKLIGDDDKNNDGDAADGGGIRSPATMDRFQAQGQLLLGYFVTNVGYFYFRDELGLDEGKLERLASQHGQVLAQRRETLKAKGDLLRSLLELSVVELGEMVSKQPSMLGLSLCTLEGRVGWLRRRYSLTAREAGHLCRVSPGLLCGSAALLEANAALLDRAVSASSSSSSSSSGGGRGRRRLERPSRGGLRRLALKAPRLLRASRLAASLRVLEAVLGADVVRRVAAVAPTALATTEATLADRLEVIRRYGRDASDASVRDCVRRAPALLTAPPRRYAALEACLGAKLDLEPPAATELCATIAPSVVACVRVEVVGSRVRFLREEVGLTAACAARVVARRPTALGLSVDANLRPTMLWLARRLLHHDEKTLAALRDLAPDDRAELASVIDRFPSLLGLSVERNLGTTTLFFSSSSSFGEDGPERISLAPKFDALLRAAPSERDATRAVLAFPPLLGYSLESRLRPRLELVAREALPFHTIVNLITATDADLPLRLEGLKRTHRQRAEPRE